MRVEKCNKVSDPRATQQEEGGVDVKDSLSDPEAKSTERRWGGEMH